MLFLKNYFYSTVSAVFLLFLSYVTVRVITGNSVSETYTFNFLTTLNQYFYLLIPALLIEFFIYRSTAKDHGNIYAKNISIPLFTNALGLFTSSLALIVFLFLNIKIVFFIFLLHCCIFVLTKIFIYFKIKPSGKLLFISLSNIFFVFSLFCIQFYFYEQSRKNSYDYEKSISMKPAMLELQTIIEEYHLSEGSYPSNITILTDKIKNNSSIGKKEWLINNITPCNKNPNLFAHEIKYYFFRKTYFQNLISEEPLPCTLNYELTGEIYKIKAYNENRKIIEENNLPLILSNEQ